MNRLNVQPNGEDVKRKYHSPRRDQQAEATRRAILDAAHQLFLENGYAATSIEAIATEAQVARQTVYDTFGDKTSLLYAVAERVVARQDDPVPIGESEAWNALRRESDPRQRVRTAARLSREMWESGMVEFETMILDTAATDTRLRELAHKATQGKREDSKAVFGILFPPEVIRADVSKDEAIDWIVAIDSAAVVRTLIEDLGWSYEQYESWLAHMMERMFLADTD